MPDGIRWVGLDVHARESTLAIFDQATGEVVTRRVVGRPHELLPWLRRVERPARVVYEAGPTGYGLARRARAEGIELDVCAPGRTERPPADRVKTDKRDAIRLARLLAAGELALVTVPSIEREQLRDLVRCREDIRADLMRARNRIGKFLLRREIYWEGRGEAWSRKHRSWLTSVRFADHASRATLADYLHAHDVLIARRDQVEADLAKLALSAPVRAHDRAAQMPAWDRHALRAGAVRRDRRVGALRSSRPARLLPRDRPERAHHRRAAPARVDHQGRLDARPAAAGRGRLPLPPRPGGRRSARAPPTRASTRDHQHLLARPAPAQRPLAPAQRHPPQTRPNRRGRDRSRARRLLLGDRHLDTPSRPGSAGIPAGGRPPHTHSLAPTEAHTNHPQETHQLTLTPFDTPVAAGEAARASPARAQQLRD